MGSKFEHWSGRFLLSRRGGRGDRVSQLATGQIMRDIGEYSTYSLNFIHAIPQICARISLPPSLDMIEWPAPSRQRKSGGNRLRRRNKSLPVVAIVGAGFGGLRAARACKKGAAASTSGRAASTLRRRTLLGTHMSELPLIPWSKTRGGSVRRPLTRTKVCPEEVSISLVSDATGHALALSR